MGVRMSGAGGEHKVVVGYSFAAEEHLAACRIDVRHLAENDARIGLVVDDTANGRGHVGGRQAGRRHLIEQRLEQMVIAPIDEGDVSVALLQPLGHGKAAEAGAGDDDVWPRTRFARRWRRIVGCLRIPDSRGLVASTSRLHALARP